MRQWLQAILAAALALASVMAGAASAQIATGSASSLAIPARQEIRNALAGRLARTSILVSGRAFDRFVVGVSEFDTGWATWSGLQYSTVDGSSEGNSYDVHVGLDRGASENPVIYGAMAAFSRPVTATDGADFSGSIFHGSVYGAFRRGTMIVGGGLNVGTGSNQVSRADAANARARSRYFSANGEFTGSAFTGFDADAVSIAPRIIATYAAESLDTFTDSAGETSGADQLYFVQLATGPRMTWDRENGGAELEVRANWNYFGWDSENREHSLSSDVSFRNEWQLDESGTVGVDLGFSHLGSKKLPLSSTVGLGYEVRF